MSRPTRSWVRVIGVLLAAVAVAAASPQTITGSVRRVLDGDSLIVSSEGRQVEVRLAGIDSPERGQPYADISRKALQGMVLGKRVRLEVLDEDRYGRTVARVHRVTDGLWVNAEMIRRGHAWAYRRHVRDRALLGMESEAKQKRRGLWALPEAEREPPWKWRRTHPTQHGRGGEPVPAR